MPHFTIAEKTANLKKAILATPHMMKVANHLGITAEAISNMVNAELHNVVRDIFKNEKAVPFDD